MFYLNAVPIVMIAIIAIFILAQWLKNNSIIDIFWGIGFIIIAGFNLISISNSNQTIPIRAFVVCTMVILWGSRLSIYLFIRNKNKPEDWRYQNFRKQWKNPLIGAFFQVFLLQGIIMLLVSFPVSFIQLKSTRTFHWFDIIAIILFLFGWIYESISDYQLFQFKKKAQNHGKIMNTGLWKFSRHPNYFGEILIWWGIYLFSIDTDFSYYNIINLISPLLITFLINKVSGVTMLESKYNNNPNYKNYITTTPALIPSFFKSN